MTISSRFIRFAPKTSRYLLASPSENLPRARSLAVNTPLTIQDGGDGGNLTLGILGATSSVPGAVRLAGQLGGTAAAPEVLGLRITGGAPEEGAQLLSMGAVQDGQVLARSGASIVGVPLVLDWQESVKRKDLATAPATPTLGDRYLIPSGADSPWDSKANQIAEWRGSETGWVYLVPGLGTSAYVEDIGVLFHFNGSAWTSPYQLSAKMDLAWGYAGLDGDRYVVRPVRKVRVGSDPAQGEHGDIWVDGSTLKYRDAGNTITVVSAGRQVSAGTGLTGGGNLSQDRTFKIASFSGIVTRDIDPAQASWNANEVKVYETLDIGNEGMLLPLGIRLPPNVNSALRNEVVFEFDDSSNCTIGNESTDNPREELFQTLALALAGGLTGNTARNGRRVKKIKLQTRNTTGNAVNDVDIEVFRLRAYAFPRGDAGPL